MTIIGTNESLWSINSQGKNDVYIDNILKKFPKIKEIIKK